MIDKTQAKTPPHKGAGHRGRLRDKFMSGGLAGFHDYEIIELLLTLATPRRDCKEAAKTALKRFKTLQGVMQATTAELQEVDGIGAVNIFGIKFIKAVADRYLEKKILNQDPLKDSRQLFDYLYHRIRDKRRECFLVLFLTTKNRVIAVENLFEGTLNASAVYPREVITAALGHRAAAVIFAHNHPSGDPQPSPEDVALTKRLVFACRVVGITVHEHIIIGDNTYYSFADEGLIVRMSSEYPNF